MYIKQNEYFTSKEDMADIIDSNFQIAFVNKKLSHLANKKVSQF